MRFTGHDSTHAVFDQHECSACLSFQYYLLGTQVLRRNRSDFILANTSFDRESEETKQSRHLHTLLIFDIGNHIIT